MKRNEGEVLYERRAIWPRSRWVKFSTFVNEQDRSIAVELALLSPRAASPYDRGAKTFTYC